MWGKGGQARLRAFLIVGLLLVSFLTLSDWGISRKPICPHGLVPSLPRVPFGSPLVWACPANALTFAPVNVVTLDLGEINDDAVRLWQPELRRDLSHPPAGDGGGSFEMVWFEEIQQRYLDVAIGDPDGDGERELLAFTYDIVGEYRVFFHVYEQGARGVPDGQSEYFVVDRAPWKMKARIADVDADGKSETVVVTDDQLVIYEHYAQVGYVIGFRTQLADARFRYGWDLGDPDADGQVEIVTSTDQGNLYVWEREVNGAWNDDLSDPAPYRWLSRPPVVWTYEVSDPAPYRWLSRPRVGDVDGDGVQEIVDVSGDHDTGKTFVSIWRHDSGAYRLVSSQTLSFGSRTRAYGYDLGDVNGDGREEIALGTVGGLTEDKAVLLSYDGTSWTVLWSAVNSAVTNHVWAGDADGDPGTTEFVFTGVHHAVDERGKITSSLYVEVFRFDGTGLHSTWVFSGEFLEAWSSHLG